MHLVSSGHGLDIRTAMLNSRCQGAELTRVQPAASVLSASEHCNR